ncbi:MAG: lysine--tRNA ligase, partial [Candidatus Heimdallarchaeota archaeon]|nr:lysine--tRNA ligase [Candidatus Heimdallarchaeota archaeon]MCK5047804.1 lysine--tRNA ligase [Candidatus Heimdallarchaeota archaeon]
FVKDFTILAKSLRPMPDKYHGIVDVEARYRHRYLDLMVNSQTRRMMRITDQVYHLMRSYLRKEGFIEVQVPILQKIYGGALANPFKTYSNALEQDVYLSIASELDLKRLIVGDMGKVFDISRDFRNEAIDSTHNPEFSMMECYAAFENYEYVMRLTENLISHISQEVLGSMKTTYQGNELDFSPPWDRVSMIQSIKDACGVDFYEITDYQEALEAGKENNIPIDQCFNRGQVIQKFFDSFVESNLIQPTFVYEFPVEISPLAKKSPKNPFIAERFEIFIGGLEIGNAFSELNDPDEQKERFMEQELLIENHDEKEAHPMDEDYINALEYGLAPTGGLGIGMERLIMILADLSSIKEALIFPQVRFSKTESEEKKV